MTEIKRVRTRQDLLDLAAELKPRDSWHEPDEQGLTARVFGKNFDNAGFWGLRHLADRETEARSRLWDPKNTGEGVIEDAERFVEIFVVLYKDNKAVAEVDLATLFAFACGYSG